MESVSFQPQAPDNSRGAGMMVPSFSQPMRTTPTWQSSENGGLFPRISVVHTQPSQLPVIQPTLYSKEKPVRKEAKKIPERKEKGDETKEPRKDGRLEWPRKRVVQLLKIVYGLEGERAGVNEDGTKRKPRLNRIKKATYRAAAAVFSADGFPVTVEQVLNKAKNLFNTWRKFKVMLKEVPDVGEALLYSERTERVRAVKLLDFDKMIRSRVVNFEIGPEMEYYFGEGPADADPGAVYESVAEEDEYCQIVLKRVKDGYLAGMYVTGDDDSAGSEEEEEGGGGTLTTPELSKKVGRKRKLGISGGSVGPKEKKDKEVADIVDFDRSVLLLPDQSHEQNGPTLEPNGPFSGSFVTPARDGGEGERRGERKEKSEKPKGGNDTTAQLQLQLRREQIALERLKVENEALRLKNDGMKLTNEANAIQLQREELQSQNMRHHTLMNFCLRMFQTQMGLPAGAPVNSGQVAAFKSQLDQFSNVGWQYPYPTTGNMFPRGSNFQSAGTGQPVGNQSQYTPPRSQHQQPQTQTHSHSHSHSQSQSQSQPQTSPQPSPLQQGLGLGSSGGPASIPMSQPDASLKHSRLSLSETPRSRVPLQAHIIMSQTEFVSPQLISSDLQGSEPGLQDPQMHTQDQLHLHTHSHLQAHTQEVGQSESPD